MFPCSKSGSNPNIILEQAFTPVVIILSRVLSKRFVLYGFNVFLEIKHGSPVLFVWLFVCLFVCFCTIRKVLLGGRYHMLITYHVFITCHSQFCMDIYRAKLFIYCYDISAVTLSNISSSVIFKCYLLQCLECHGLHFSTQKVCKWSYMVFVLKSLSFWNCNTILTWIYSARVHNSKFRWREKIWFIFKLF